MIGNVRGRKNWFYHLCRRAESGLDNFHYAKITAADAISGGVLDEAEIAEAKEVLPLAVYQELYEAQASDNNSNPFGEAAIRACIGPMSTDAPFVYGVDLAKSQDWTVIIGLDSSNRVCFFERFQLPWVEQRKRLIEVIGSTDCVIDSTGVGDPITEDLQRVLPRVEGFKFSSSSKQQLMELLSTKISTQGVTYPDGDIVRELEQFEYEYSRTGVKYNAPPGLHDDCVMALALALRGQQNVPGLGVW
jgi:phage FluMu gp28-like protein